MASAGIKTCIYLAKVVILVSYATISPAEESRALGSKGAWSSFKEGTDCWLSTSPIRAPTQAQGRNTLFVVAYRAEYSEPIIFFKISGQIDIRTSARVADMRFQLESDSGFHYITESDSEKFLNAMFTAKNVSVGSIMFSLKGFENQYRHISRLCDFKS